MSDNLAYQEEFREELINGKIVAMSPRPFVNHNRIAFNIAFLFERYLRGKKCMPFSDGTTVYLTDKDHFVPDMMVVCDRNKIKRKGIYGAPDLVVEVLSPSTAKNDRGYKKSVYEANGIPEYWIVDPSNKSIEVYLLQNGHYVLDNVYTFYPAEEIEEMTDDEKSNVVTEFKCHLYDDLAIRLDDIFDNIL